MTTVAEALRAAAAGIGGESPRADVELLMADTLGRSRGWLLAHADDPLEPTVRDAFLARVARRAEGEPVAHILGRRGFWTLELEVNADTLVPRPDTERLVELVLERLPTDAEADVLDLGTGTGAIALAIASERKRARVTAVDASAGALTVAARNAARLGLERVRLLRSDWFSALGGERFDLIAANPPYIADADPHLAQGDLRFEPRTALASGVDGLDDLRRIVATANAHLRPGGHLLLEHGYDQGAAVRALLAAAGFTQIGTAQDWEQRDRVGFGTWPG